MSAFRDHLIAAAVAMGKKLRSQSVFVGGATVFLYLDDQDSEEIRATDDVDVIVELASRAEWYEIERIARDAGFNQSLTEDDPICRFRQGHITLDIMPTLDDILGFTNSWYIPAFRTADTIHLLETLDIRVVSLQYFMATKLAAYQGRGQGDLLSSKDAEDLFVVLGGRRKLIKEFESFNPEVRNFIAGALAEIQANGNYANALAGNFSPALAERIRTTINNLIQINRILG